jgi:hypothetical protein
LPLRIRVVVGVKVKMGLCAGCSLAITFGVGCRFVLLNYPQKSVDQ